MQTDEVLEIMSHAKEEFLGAIAAKGSVDRETMHVAYAQNVAETAMKLLIRQGDAFEVSFPERCAARAWAISDAMCAERAARIASKP